MNPGFHEYEISDFEQYLLSYTLDNAADAV